MTQSSQRALLFYPVERYACPLTGPIELPATQPLTGLSQLAFHLI